MNPIFLFICSLMILSCTDRQNAGNDDAGNEVATAVMQTNTDHAKEKIRQSIDAEGKGAINDLYIDVEVLNDSTVRSIHTFLNPTTGQEMRITREYHFVNDFDSITSFRQILTERRSKGKWEDIII